MKKSDRAGDIGGLPKATDGTLLPLVELPDGPKDRENMF